MRRVLCWQQLQVRGGSAAHARGGVTVLEVLFSIGIVTVGLLGVMIIVPLAGLRTSQGTIADGADRLGRNAIRAFDVYQMRRPDSWAQLDPSGAAQYIAFTGGEPFCIDPLYMAANASKVGIFRFPYLGAGATPVPNDVPFMRRISLRTFPGATLPSAIPGARLSRIMSEDQARQFFLGEDDLVFNLPKDRTAPPQQRYSFDDSAAPATAERLKRQWEGKFSWLATLVPKPGYSSDTYLLSIVVFHRREPHVDAERIVDVPSFSTAGYKGVISSGENGGEVVLHAGSTWYPRDPKADLQMKEGEWLMLAGYDTATSRGYFQWYRIQTADAGPVPDTAGTGYDRDLTLFGRDWPIGVVDVTKAVWMPGVVAVYEKTIRLENSSLWTGL